MGAEKPENEKRSLVKPVIIIVAVLSDIANIILAIINLLK